MAATLAELARMRAEHVPGMFGMEHCQRCCACMDEDICLPCDAARLLDHFAPVPVPYMAGIATGLLGPVYTEELPQ